MRFSVLGGGMVGRVMAIDLAADDSDVLLADRDPGVEGMLKGTRVKFRCLDLDSDDGVADAVKDADVVVGAVPGFMGYRTMRRVIESGRDLVDIAFMPEDARGLAPLAEKRGVTVVYDCGVAPGVSNMMVGRSGAEMDTLDRVRIMVGGLPVERVRPFEYKAPFSPTDVLEEYVRPARLVRCGKVVEMPALSEVEDVNFEGIGTLEAFNTDGLRSLLDTTDCPDMAEKTLRYPGHAELMRILAETGFLSDVPVDIHGVAVSPRKIAERLLFPLWELKDGEEEFTVMRIIVEGRKKGAHTVHRYDLLDRTDPATGFTSMSRTTGFPCTLVAREVAAGRLELPGVHPPETLGNMPDTLGRILNGLKERGVDIRISVEGGR